MPRKLNKVFKRRGSPRASSSGRSYGYEEEENLTESTREFQEEILRGLDHTMSGLREIRETNQLMIQRNNSILQLLDLLLLVVIFYGSTADGAEGGPSFS